MNTLIGFAIGVLSTAVITAVVAAMATVAFGNTEPLPFYAGVAAGTVTVLALVSYFA